MQHSVKNIGDNYEKLSIMRKDKNQFKANDFFQFANDNKKKYSIIENGDDLLVSTWYSDSLIKDYQSTIQNFKGIEANSIFTKVESIHPGLSITYVESDNVINDHMVE